jgi:hypothetical protein
MVRVSRCRSATWTSRVSNSEVRPIQVICVDDRGIMSSTLRFWQEEELGHPSAMETAKGRQPHYLRITLSGEDEEKGAVVNYFWSIPWVEPRKMKRKVGWIMNGEDKVEDWFLFYRRRNRELSNNDPAMSRRLIQPAKENSAHVKKIRDSKLATIPSRDGRHRWEKETVTWTHEDAGK